jgi:hypothetical protein
MAKPLTDKSNPNKRKLKFQNFDEVMIEVQRLLENGYVSHGKWNLAQSLVHLHDWMRFPMDGFPTQPLPIRGMMWVMSKTVAPAMLKKIIANGFSDGGPTMPSTVPPPDVMSDEASAKQYQETIERLMSHDGQMHRSPLFGPMDRERVEQLNLLHAAHHLGFLEPQLN